MAEDIHYTRARREHYLTEIGVATQLGAIVDELRAFRVTLGDGYGAPSFTDLCGCIDRIKAAIPKPDGQS